MAANAEKEQADNPLNLHSSELHSTASAPMDDSKPTAASRGRSRSRHHSQFRGRSVSRSRRRSVSRYESVVRSGNRSPLINPESEGGIGSTWADKVKGLAMRDKTTTARGQSSNNIRLAWDDGARTEPQAEYKNTPKETPVPAPVDDGAMSAKRRAIESAMFVESFQQHRRLLLRQRRLLPSTDSQVGSTRINAASRLHHALPLTILPKCKHRGPAT
ncbi:hypothetical protein HPB51_012997 [Rhipicephalus microplus]|uniref:Uncharacterized protein n=1 Tax=Rhipicephalus microplus TaxID=6941 RepID=A0A9J6F2I2_RHIMP|nr:hypothetical protein HPB51_012997 [Rhipicephalus microplus]